MEGGRVGARKGGRVVGLERGRKEERRDKEG